MKKIVEIKNITKSFDGEVVLDNINLDIYDNEFITLLGPSGCGKTTLLRIIGGFETPDSGDVIFMGENINGLPPHKRNVNTVFQRYALFPHLNVFENVAFSLREKKVPKAEIQKAVTEMLSLVALKGFEKRAVTSLSGGQQQRVAIARALVKMPRVLLLDEPLSNLDARLRLQTREEIRRIQQETGITTIFVTHDQDEAMSISDMIVVMKDGVVQQIGAPQEVYDSPVNLFVATFLGTPPINVLDGEVKGEKLYIGGAAVCDVPGVGDQPVSVGIRPEGFTLDENGPFEVSLSRVEVMGRDTSVVSTHPASRNPVIRSIIPARNKVDKTRRTVRFTLMPDKVFLFDAQTDLRIPFDGQ